MTLLSESGQWKQGKNELRRWSSRRRRTSSRSTSGKVTLSTSMPMPGMAPMIAGATLEPDEAPGRYRGTISFPDSGDRQVTVSVGRSGRQGLDEVLRAGPLGHAAGVMRRRRCCMLRRVAAIVRRARAAHSAGAS